MRKKILLFTIFVLCTAAFSAIAARLVQQQRRSAVLEKQNAVLAQRAARWEEIALRFERLNRECLEITFGGTR